MTPEKFRQIVRRARLALGISQRKLADLSGLSVSYISEIESGKRVPQVVPTINMLSKALKLNPVYLAWAAGVVHPRATWVDGPQSVKTSLGEIPKSETH